MSASILVYGAGPLGSVFAARLQQGGNNVSLLARGQRLHDLREHGIVLHHVSTDVWTTTHVNVVEALAPGDAYDLVLIIMRKNHALKILPVLAANTACPNILFLHNNAAGPGALVDALGASRVLIGFPSAAGYREGHIVHCLAGTEVKEAGVPFGEVDGQITERTQAVARILDSTVGFTAEIRTDMDAWLKYHVALLMPSLAAALYMCGTDNYRLARTRDGVVLAVRAIREGFRGLQALGYPITPRRFRPFMWVPEPILVPLVRKLLASPHMETALARHAEAARDEVQHLTDELLSLIEPTGVPLPNIRHLYPYLSPGAPTIPDGSAEIPLDWRSTCIAAAVATSLVLGAIGTWLLIRDSEGT